MEEMKNFPEQIAAKIFVLRGQKVIFDSDLAELYGVETKRLLEQVRRNTKRFPEDFAFLPNSEELLNLRSQIATTKLSSGWNYMRRNPPWYLLKME